MNGTTARKLPPSQLRDEICEQPAVLARLLDEGRNDVDRLAHAIRNGGINQVVVAGRGTSDNAGRYAQYVLGARHRMLVTQVAPSLFTRYRTVPPLSHKLVLGISQSGSSPDIVEVLEQAGRQGALTAVITNDPESDLAAVATHVLTLGAGPERSVAATKTYTASLAVIALLSALLGRHESDLDALGRIPASVEDALEMVDDVADVMTQIGSSRTCLVVGRGYDYPTACEWALKLKELTYTFADAYSSAELVHGPIALVHPGCPAFVIGGHGTMLHDAKGVVAALTERGATVVGVGNAPELLDRCQLGLRLADGIPEWLAPLVTVIPGQLLACLLASDRLKDPDRPRGLNKVTRTY